MIIRIIKTYLIIFCFFSANLFSQNLPLNLYWSGKTDSALVLANKIVANKKIVSASYLTNAYDFLAEYNLEQGHFENNLKYIALQFRINKNNSLDSALFYGRLANYYHCYLMHDSSTYFIAKATKTLLHYSFKKRDKISYSRYYSYIGNGARNTKYRDVKFLDSAIALSDIPFLKALHYRRYGTFLSDLLNLSEQQWTLSENLNMYHRSITYLTKAEALATSIYPNKKSSLHSSIYKIWSIILKYRKLDDASLVLADKTKEALVVDNTVLNYSDYSAIITWESSINMSLYYKTHDIKYLYKNETSLLKSIPIWENFYKIEVENHYNGFDDQYNINPYQKLLAVYFELFQATKNQIYIYKCYNLIEFIKKLNKEPYANELINHKSKMLDSISFFCKKENCSVINYLITHNPVLTIAIISLPDTTLMINCSINSDYIPLQKSNKIFQRDSIRSNTSYFKKTNYLMYEAYFKKIDSILTKRNIKKVTIINDGFLNSLNFDMLQTDSVKHHSFSSSALINRYNFTYTISGYILLKKSRQVIKYKYLNILVPNFASHKYPKLLFSETLINKLKVLFNIQKCDASSNQCFLKPNQLFEYIGHINSNDKSVEQELILNDTIVINSNCVLNKNLDGSSYLLNGCGSGIGREVRFDKINSFPYILMNQHAHAVICSIWPIDDKENAEFLEKFYSFMAQGLASSDALYETKLYFAKQNYSPSMWGAYVYYGSDFYLSKNHHENIFLYLAISVFVLLLLFLFLIYKQRKQNAKTQQ